jgi:hypothetical protein
MCVIFNGKGTGINCGIQLVYSYKPCLYILVINLHISHLTYFADKYFVTSYMLYILP